MEHGSISVDRTGLVTVDREAVVNTAEMLEAAGDAVGLEALAYAFADTDLEEFIGQAWIRTATQRSSTFQGRKSAV